MSETIEQKCLSKGVKLTDQRKIIAQVMSESSDHPDVDELYLYFIWAPFEWCHNSNV